MFHLLELPQSCIFNMIVAKCKSFEVLTSVTYIKQKVSVFLHSSVGKEPACNSGHPGSIPGLGRSAVEEMAILSNILAWILLSNVLSPCTKKPRRLQLIGSQRVGHDCSNLAQVYWGHGFQMISICIF